MALPFFPHRARVFFAIEGIGLRSWTIADKESLIPDSKEIALLPGNRGPRLFQPAAEGARLAQFVGMYGERVPRNTFFGDGSEIPAEDLQAIRDTFKSAEMSFPWRAVDVMLLGNMQMAHGRKPFTGSRNVVASLPDAHASGGDAGEALRALG